MQADVFGMLLGQAAQSLTLVLAEHAPFESLRQFWLSRAQMVVWVLRGEAHRPIGVLARF